MLISPKANIAIYCFRCYSGWHCYSWQ